MIKKTQASRLLIYRILITVCFLHFKCHAEGGIKKHSQEQLLPSLINIGVIRNQNSPFSTMINSCMEMAVSDFYSASRTFTMRLELVHKDVNDVLDSDLSVVELLEQERVHGILELQGPIDEVFVSMLGSKLAKVPIISFAARGSTLSEAESPYFVRAAVDDGVQARALAAVCQEFKWKKVVVLYEDTEFGYLFLSHLSKVFGDVGIELPHLTAIALSSDESRLINELESLKVNQTVNVFLVHMNASLGSRLLSLAKRVGMMSKGYAWIITDSVSIFLNSMGHNTHDSMDGVLGIRPHVPLSKNLLDFHERWKRNYSMSDLNVYGLRAYDMVTALAKAVEKIPRSSSHERNTKSTHIRTSTFGHLLVREVFSGNGFSGLSGDFEVVDGKLRPSEIEVFNVVGTGEKTVGFWTLDRGLLHRKVSSGWTKKGLRKVTWPGDSVELPKGYSFVPPSEALRVRVPCRSGSSGFVNVMEVVNHETNEVKATGFAITVFLEALKMMPFRSDHKFYCYGDMNNSNWSYDDMLRNMPEKFDMVVADTTIWAPRTEYVDFSLPYLASGIVLIVRKKPLDMWMFAMPLSWNLWLAILVSCVFMGLVILVLERRREPNTDAASEEEEEDSNKRIRASYLAPVAVLAFQERNMVVNKCSIFVLVCWMFMAFVLMQSFTANLSAILTVDQLKFAFSEDYCVGYRGSSFTKNFLMENLNIDESRLKNYITDAEFDDAMSKGSKNGGIDAIFDETPLIRNFLKQYESAYRIVGPTYSTAGLGFAFPIGSPLVAEFSRAIVNITERQWWGHSQEWRPGSDYSSLSVMEGHSTRLTFREFSGLFCLLASAVVVAVICSETAILSKLQRIMSKCFCWKNIEVASSDELQNEEQEIRDVSVDHEEIVEEAKSNTLHNVGDDSTR